MKTFRTYPNEEFREITIPDTLRLRYAISNKGRLVSFKDDVHQGRLLKGGMVDGYRIFQYKVNQDGKLKCKHIFIAKLVATYFLEKTSEDQTYVLHLDRKRDNDDVKNLQWATREEMLEHSKNSPFVIKAKIESSKRLYQSNLKADGRKLTITKVMLIKKILARPNQNTRLKMIAKQFGVSEMQIRRIKSGENWGYIKI